MLPTTPIFLGALAVGGTPTELPVPDFSDQVSLAWVAVVPPEDAPPTVPDDALPAPVDDRVEPYGSKGSWRWYIQTGYGFEPANTENQLAIAGGGVSYFIVDNLSLQAELNGLYIRQNGPDAGGLNLTILARWHFLARDRWSLYGDLGAGIMGTTAQVPGPDANEPRGGGYFSFTPQAGLGFSCEVGQDTRLLLGARWYHISNARTRQSNPPRDSIMFYLGLSFPLN